MTMRRRLYAPELYLRLTESNIDRLQGMTLESALASAAAGVSTGVQTAMSVAISTPINQIVTDYSIFINFR